MPVTKPPVQGSISAHTLLPGKHGIVTLPRSMNGHLVTTFGTPPKLYDLEDPTANFLPDFDVQCVACPDGYTYQVTQ